MGYDVMAAWQRKAFEFNDEIQERGVPYQGQIDYDSLAGRSITRDNFVPPQFTNTTSRWSPSSSPISGTSPKTMFPQSQSPRQASPMAPALSERQSSASPPRADSAISGSPLVSHLDSKSLANKLYAASAAGDLQHVKLLLSLGAPVNGSTIVSNLYEAFKPAKPGFLSPLAGAATYGHLETATYLISHGAIISPDINISSSSPLQQACRADDIVMTSFLLKKGAEVNQANCYKSTPLMYAVKYGSPELVNLVLSYQPNLGASSFMGSSAAHWCIWPARLAILELLLRAGADPDDMLADESTLLHCAALSGWTDGVKLLVNYGADPFRRDADWRTPLDVAIANKSEDAAGIIEAAMLLAS